MLLGHLIAYCTCPCPMLWGRVLVTVPLDVVQQQHFMCPLAKWSYIVLFLQLRNLRLRGAKLTSHTTNKQVVDSEARLKAIFKTSVLQAGT